MPRKTGNKKKQTRKKRVKKQIKRNVAKRVEMIKMSQGSSKAQAITPIFHKADDPATNYFNVRIPDKIYYQQTSSSNLSNPTIHDMPSLNQRIDGNAIFSKYLNYRLRLDFDNCESFNGNIRTRIIAGTFKDAPDAVPHRGWISDQVGTPNSPEICDSDFQGCNWTQFMEEQLSAFYSGQQIWGGLLEKARWNVIYDRTFNRNPRTATAVQTFTGNTPAWSAGHVGGGEDADEPWAQTGHAPGLNAGNIQSKYTRRPIEVYIDFSKSKACNKKLYYGANVSSAYAMSYAPNQAVVYKPDGGSGDRGLASTTARDVPFVIILQPDHGETESHGSINITDRWCHYFQDA